ncbi:MAG: hypothetical protein ACJ786_34805 [Catenulispora sp.]
MALDTDAYIRDLAAIHGLAPKPGDSDLADLTSRAVRAELEEIRARTQALHDWSAAIIADHDTGRPHTAETGTDTAAAHRPRHPRRFRRRRRRTAAWPRRRPT